MPDDWLSDTRSSYDTDASGYAEKVRGLLDGSPYLRASLALFAELVGDAGGGPVADVGCGPGYVTSYLHDIGVDAVGIDLSPEMIAIARRDHDPLTPAATEGPAFPPEIAMCPPSRTSSRKWK